MFLFLELLFATAPAYLIRFRVGAFGLNYLEVACAIFIAAFPVWLARKSLTQDFKNFLRSRPKALQISIGLFLLAGIISAVISPDHSRAAGLFLAFFLEPILIFPMAAYLLQDPARKQQLIRLIYWLILIFSAYGIFQYITRVGLPAQYLGNSVEPKRALSVFEYPNAFALWLAPLLAYSLAFLNSGDITPKWLRYLAPIVGLLGLLVSESRGGWIGFAVAAIIFVLFVPNKKLKFSLLAAGIIAAMIVYSVPVFRYRLILPFKGDKSSVSRLSYSHTAIKMVKDSPLLGEGLYGFASNFQKYNTDPNLGAVNYPHNIIWNFWVETGVLGLLSFIAISLLLALRSWKYRSVPYSFGFLLFLIALWIHGLADVPYFLNDLALTFWIMAALAI